mgnify:CR=1 FL=1
MPQATIRNDAPTINVRNTDVPKVKIRYSGVLTAAIPGTTFGGKGYLIGMLGLTYIKSYTIGSTPASFKSDDIPTVNIRNTD